MCHWITATIPGYICEEHNNPSDFFLDVINGDSTAVSSTQDKHEKVGDGVVSSNPAVDTGISAVSFKHNTPTKHIHTHVYHLLKHNTPT